MTIYTLGIESLPFEEKNERAAIAAARRAERPLACDSLGGLTTGDTKLLWALIVTMWDQDPQHRPTASGVRDGIPATLWRVLDPNLAVFTWGYSTEALAF